MSFAVVFKQILELGVDDDGFSIRVIEDVGDVVGFQSVIDCDVDCSCRANAKDALKESGRVRAQNADFLPSVLLDVVCQSSGPIGGFLVGSSEDLVVRSLVIDGRCLSQSSAD